MLQSKISTAADEAQMSALRSEAVNVLTMKLRLTINPAYLVHDESAMMITMASMPDKSGPTMGMVDGIRTGMGIGMGMGAGVGKGGGGTINHMMNVHGAPGVGRELGGGRQSPSSGVRPGMGMAARGGMTGAVETKGEEHTRHLFGGIGAGASQGGLGLDVLGGGAGLLGGAGRDYQELQRHGAFMDYSAINAANMLHGVRGGRGVIGGSASNVLAGIGTGAPLIGAGDIGGMMGGWGSGVNEAQNLSMQRLLLGQQVREHVTPIYRSMHTLVKAHEC